MFPLKALWTMAGSGVRSSHSHQTTFNSDFNMWKDKKEKAFLICIILYSLAQIPFKTTLTSYFRNSNSSPSSCFDSHSSLYTYTKLKLIWPCSKCYFKLFPNKKKKNPTNTKHLKTLHSITVTAHKKKSWFEDSSVINILPKQGTAFVLQRTKTWHEFQTKWTAHNLWVMLVTSVWVWVQDGQKWYILRVTRVVQEA